ncbi:hypothetical protein RIF29_20337 [Crotalaria pallida]|uniref:Uncharacterized protein n=1 Tax=Crotalaria pallida TaxID=3830 RepID=A0AAN9F114_CROPI
MFASYNVDLQRKRKRESAQSSMFAHNNVDLQRKRKREVAPQFLVICFNLQIIVNLAYGGGYHIFECIENMPAMRDVAISLQWLYHLDKWLDAESDRTNGL